MNAFSPPAFGRLYRTLFAGLLATLVAGCVTWVAPFDKDGLARITEISKSSLAVYQSLLDTKSEARGAAFTGKLAVSWAQVETQARVHLVFEQSREKNSGSIDAANELMGFWEQAKQNYCSAAKPDLAIAASLAASAPASSGPATGWSVQVPSASAPIVAENNACAGQGRGNKEAMVDFVLKQDRKVLERILGAMVKAEEAKKLAGGATN